jgi:hypothetical protein
MTGILCALLGILSALGMTVLSDMASEEVRDRLDHLPHAILRLAARRLPPGQRATVYEEEWLPELTYILKGAETRPITRLITGTRYALGILRTADQISRRLGRSSTESATQPMSPQYLRYVDSKGKSRYVRVEGHSIRVRSHYVRQVDSTGRSRFVLVKGHYRRRPWSRSQSSRNS